MTRLRQKRVAIISILALALLIAVPAVATWRAVRQERLNRALIAAVKANDDKAVVTLLQEGADANCRDEPSRKLSLWETLMQVVRGRKSQPSHAPTPLLIALEPKYIRNRTVSPPENLRLVAALLDHGAKDNQTDELGGTPIGLAIWNCKNASARILLQQGADVNIADAAGCTPLMGAQSQDDTELLLSHGAHIDATDYEGNTALMRSEFDNTAIVLQCLLQHGANINIRNRSGETALSLAQVRLSYVEQILTGDPMAAGAVSERKQIIHLLKAAGAKR